MDDFPCCNGEVPATPSRLPLSVRAPASHCCLLGLCILSCASTSVDAAFHASHAPGGITALAHETEAVLIDLSKREVFVPLTVRAAAQDIQISIIEAKNLPTPHHLVPRQGMIHYGQPLDIILREPAGVRIRLALVTRGDEPALRISPQFVLKGDESIELTQDRIERAARSLQRRVKDLHQRIAALASARHRLQLWLASPGNKPLDTVRAARARLKVLEQEIRMQQLELPAAQNQYLTLQKIAEFAAQTHGQAEIHYSVHARRRKEQ